MLQFDDAVNQLLDESGLFPLPEVLTRSVNEAYGQILADPVYSKVAVPPFDNAAMDGIAFNLDDLSSGEPLTLSQTVFAGQAATPLQPGTAARIFTGALIPEGANTVEMQENCIFNGNEVAVNSQPKFGQHIRKCAEDITENALLLKAGTKLQAKHIGFLASTGIDKVKVFKPLTVALIANGDELVSPPEKLKPGQIYNSNLPMLRAQLLSAGFQVHDFLAADNLNDIIDKLKLGMQSCQVVITTGGVSVGEADYVKEAIDSLGEINIWKVAMKPGKPFTFGKLIDDHLQIPIIGLPGNPVSAFTSFQLFALPFLNKLQGEETLEKIVQSYPIALDQPVSPKREEFIRVKLTQIDEKSTLIPYKKQGSGVLSSVVFSTGFARLPKNKTTQNDDIVAYIPFSN